MSILDINISKQDMDTSFISLKRLRPYMEGRDRSLVFFVGAGISMAGNTGMPNTPSLIYQLLLDSIMYSGSFDEELESYKKLLKDASYKLGFEITLNDFWQICRDATSSLYSAFAELEEQCIPNSVHTFLAHWLETNGTVVTTNYDRLIEQEWQKITRPIKSVYQDENANSFATWQEDLQKGGCLFKIHGSLDDPLSCLGALEHVGTQLNGNRAELLIDIMQNRPLCFVGWRGIDPDIPPLLRKALDTRDSSLPIFWIHYEGNPSGSQTLDASIQAMTADVRVLSNQNPIITEADRAFGEMLQWVGRKRDANAPKKILSFDFQSSVRQCTKTGVTRMTGIALRRSGRLDIAERILDAALSLAETNEERSAALQELSLLQQQIGGRKTDASRKYLSKARKELGDQPDPWQQLNIDFGLLSQTIIALKNRPWLFFKVSGLFHQYEQDIELFRKETSDKESAALHESLYHLYKGRFRFKVFGWLATIVTPLADWIIAPFDVARLTIGDAKDIHLHSRIDVLAYRTIAIAYLRHCKNLKEEMDEIARLVTILNDDARSKHWENQKREIAKLCGIN